MQPENFTVACVGNYLPRQCGIATFTKDLTVALKNTMPADTNIFVVAINDGDEVYDYPPDVEFQIRQEDQKSYIKAAAYINQSGAKVCVLQHEYGIFGGINGRYVLSLTRKLRIPLIVTLHTVLNTPLDNEKMILQELAETAEKIVVMSRKAVRFLIEIYNIPESKIDIVHHGVPDLPFSDKTEYKKQLGMENKKLILTFGFFSQNKGIETMIKALPDIIEKHPDVMYLCLGKTHPNVYKTAGNDYRDSIIRLVEKYNIQDNVTFIEKFVSLEKLHVYLSATDIYVTPYVKEAQITSGTLAYAVGAGTAVVSTPYWYAQEILADNRGKLFNFHDHRTLTRIINRLLENPDELNQLRKNAYLFGRGMTWKAVGKRYRNLFRSAIRNHKTNNTNHRLITPVAPPFKLDHMERLTDDTGMLQHAKYATPNRFHGYCIDDNARALLVANTYYHASKDENALRLINIYLSFVHYMARDNGHFRNFMHYNRKYLDESGSDDAFGRTLWALGDIIAKAPQESYLETAKECFEKAVPNVERLTYIRGKALSMIGLACYLKKFPNDTTKLSIIKAIKDNLISSFEQTASEDWQWFEPELVYDNAMLPLSLFYAYSVTKDEKALDIAVKSLEFLEKVTFRNGCFSPVGSDSWYKRGRECSKYAQQPIETAAMILMYKQAHAVTQDKKYHKKMLDTFNWFMGDNHLYTPLYDFETGGCCDGLEEDGTNKNQGAESLLSYLISQLAMIESFGEG